MNNATKIAALEATIRNAKAELKALKEKAIGIFSVVTLKKDASYAVLSEIGGMLTEEFYFEVGRDSGSPRKCEYTVVDVKDDLVCVTGKNYCGDTVIATLPVDCVVNTMKVVEPFALNRNHKVKTAKKKTVVRKFAKGDTVYLIKDYHRFKHTVLIVNNDGTLLVEGRRKKHFLVNVAEIA